jgi:cysteinyl-tRNA synthetase
VQTPLIGIDEHTALIIDPVQNIIQIEGTGTITLIIGNISISYSSGEVLDIESLMTCKRLPARKAVQSTTKKQTHLKTPLTGMDLPNDLSDLLQKRLMYKIQKEYKECDVIRTIFINRGYIIQDTESGQEIYKSEE